MLDSKRKPATVLITHVKVSVPITETYADQERLSVWLWEGMSDLMC